LSPDAAIHAATRSASGDAVIVGAVRRGSSDGPDRASVFGGGAA